MDGCLGVCAMVPTFLKCAFQQVLAWSYVTIALIMLGILCVPKEGTSTYDYSSFPPDPGDSVGCR